MNIADIVVSCASGILSGGVGVALINAVFNRGGQRAQTAKAESDTWRQEAAENYANVKQQCADCRKDLAAAKREHNDQLRMIRRELADVKAALVKRVDVVDEMLSAQQQNKPLSDERLVELRAENRAVRTAIVRSYP